ncbi:unnamed protein product [Cylindrotheca closterium]|uniref:VWFD domain-containing protein n=1 Tax=Cylindrotheca closterium TaxID=2856 RepID=A0AAD2D144_9STRA|nr:unnamed protein product [Cylindrotheca closterium]
MKVFNILSVLAALATVVNALPTETCAQQSECISFDIKKMDSDACGIGGDCVVEICMFVSGTSGNCIKGGTDTFSHMCMQSDASGCPAWKEDGAPALGEGDSTTCTASGEGYGTVTFDGKCSGNDVLMCQEGKPGDTLYWILKDGGSTIEEDVTYDLPYTVAGETEDCSNTVRCFNGEYNCGENDNKAQQARERTWSFTIPEGDGSSCDVCAPGTPPGDEPPTDETPTDTPPTGTPPTDEPPTDEPPTGTPPTDEPPTDTPPTGTPPTGSPPTDEPPISTPPLTPEDPEEPAVAAPTSENESTPTPGSNGDPHFKTWNGEHFEFHGQCDLVLAKDADFAEGLGLDIQIRTKLVRYWSYIKRAAIRIGEDILEIEGSVDEQNPVYWINFEHQREDAKTIGGFPLNIIASTGRFRKHHFEIDLSSKYPGVKIAVSTMKEFIKVDFVGATEEAFGNVVGILGEFKTGKTLGRDQATEVHDFNQLGNEWQVQPMDHMLFHDVSDPQFPKRCVLPEDPQGQRRRRLEESSVTVEDAEKACSTLADELSRKDCVYDIIATQDMDMVGAF